MGLNTMDDDATWATARCPRRPIDSRARDEPVAIADDQPGEGVVDLHMKVKTPPLHELVGISARRQRPRQRDPAHAPAADHEPDATAFAYQRHDEIERAEPFAQQPFEAPAPLRLHAREYAAGE